MDTKYGEDRENATKSCEDRAGNGYAQGILGRPAVLGQLQYPQYCVYPRLDRQEDEGCRFGAEEREHYGADEHERCIDANKYE